MKDSELYELLSSIEGFQVRRIMEKSEYSQKRDIHFAFSITSNEFPDNKMFIAFDGAFPNSKPTYFVEDLFIPHVEPDGYICYSDVNSMVNPELPKEIIEETFAKASKTLRDGISGTNKSDFNDEFAEYWHRNKYLEKELFIQFCAEVPEDIIELRYARFNNRRPKPDNLVVASTDEELKKYAHRFFNRQVPDKSKSLFIATISEEYHVTPPKYDNFWSILELREFLETNMDENSVKQLHQKLRLIKRLNSKEYFILGIPSKNGKVLVAVEFSGLKSNIHPLLPDGGNCRIKPILIVRSDKKLISKRGGAEEDMDKKKILLVGAGSVGSKLAYEVIKLGIGELTIIDDDDLEESNLYRHELGVSSLNQNKAKAIAMILTKEFPYTTVKHHCLKLEHCISKAKIDLRSYDLIISATGDTNVNLFLNKYLKDNTLSVPVIYCWNEALGIGGHACLISETQGSCLQCLYIENPTFQSRVSFSKPGQTFNKKLAGCSTSFVPFSSLDSMRTAVLTLGLIKDFLTGLEVNNQIISWKGASRYFVESGFETSGRYELSDQSLFEKRFNLKNLNEDEKCKVCG